MPRVPDRAAIAPTPPGRRLSLGPRRRRSGPPIPRRHHRREIEASARQEGAIPLERPPLALARPGWVDPQGGLADEADELLDFGNTAQVGLDPVESRALRPPFLVEDAERLTQPGDGLGAEPRAAQADGVQAGDAVVTLLEDERWDVLGGGPKPAQHGQAADPDP